MSSIEGASFRFGDILRQCRFVGTAGEAVPSGIGTDDWLILQRWEQLSGADGKRLFDFVTSGTNYLSAYRSPGTKDLEVGWYDPTGGVANATITTSATEGVRYGTCQHVAIWRDGLTLRVALLLPDGTSRTASAVLSATHDLDTLQAAGVAYIGSSSGGSYSQGHFGHLSMWTGVTGSDITALTDDEWVQLHTRPQTAADIVSGATLAMSYSRLADSSGDTLAPTIRTTMPAGTRYVDTVSGNYMTLAIGSPSGDNTCYMYPKFMQPARSTDLQNHQFVQPQIAEIQGNLYAAAVHGDQANNRVPLIYPLGSDWTPNAWPIEVPIRRQYTDASDGNATKTLVGTFGINVSTDYHYCSCIAPGTGNQAIVVMGMHGQTNANEPDTGDTLYDTFGGYRVNLTTGVTTWEQIDLGGALATNLFTYCAMYTPPGAGYTLAFVRQADNANAKGYAIQFDHSSGGSSIQLTEPGTTITGFFPQEVLALGGGCFGFTYLDRHSVGGPSGYRMLVWDSSGAITSSSNWYETSGGTSPTLPLDVDDLTGLMHTINSGEPIGSRDAYIGQSIADQRGNMILCLVRYEGELDDAWPDTPDAVEIHRFRNFSPETHTFGLSDITDITSTITAVKSTEAFNLQPVISWINSSRTVASMAVALMNGAALVEGTDYDQFTGEFGRQAYYWHGRPVSTPGVWTLLSDNPVADIATDGGLSLRPMPCLSPNESGGPRAIIETVFALNGVGAGMTTNRHVLVPELDFAANGSVLRRPVIYPTAHALTYPLTYGVT